eukprot:jgi/Botrbrau1/11652/Bobra.168_2s0009.1
MSMYFTNHTWQGQHPDGVSMLCTIRVFADLVRVTINAITPGDIADPPPGIDPVQPQLPQH